MYPCTHSTLFKIFVVRILSSGVFSGIASNGQAGPDFCWKYLVFTFFNSILQIFFSLLIFILHRINISCFRPFLLGRLELSSCRPAMKLAVEWRTVAVRFRTVPNPDLRFQNSWWAKETCAVMNSDEIPAASGEEILSRRGRTLQVQGLKIHSFARNLGNHDLALPMNQCCLFKSLCWGSPVWSESHLFVCDEVSSLLWYLCCSQALLESKGGARWVADMGEPVERRALSIRGSCGIWTHPDGSSDMVEVCWGQYHKSWKMIDNSNQDTRIV